MIPKSKKKSMKMMVNSIVTFLALWPLMHIQLSHLMLRNRVSNPWDNGPSKEERLQILLIHNHKRIKEEILSNMLQTLPKVASIQPI